LKRKLIIFFNTFIIFFIITNIAFANIQENLINKLNSTKTLTFNFKQTISEKEETGDCYIKYPLLMKCNYKNVKQKVIVSNGKTVAIIKKKYKKIYYYPIEATPLFTILDKEKILNLIKNKKPTKINSEIIEFEYIDEKLNKLIILFDKNTLNLKGWETKDAYSNEVSFLINDLKINNEFAEDFFKIPYEKDL
tara:strand:- start:348 stop:926 length:579 start_codon:yes stop_codon:yes gene_type:complete